MPNAARTTVFPLPRTSHAAPKRGAKSPIIAIYMRDTGKPGPKNLSIPEFSGWTLGLKVERLLCSEGKAHCIRNAAPGSRLLSGTGRANHPGTNPACGARTFCVLRCLHHPIESSSFAGNPLERFCRVASVVLAAFRIVWKPSRMSRYSKAKLERVLSAQVGDTLHKDPTSPSGPRVLVRWSAPKGIPALFKLDIMEIPRTT